MKKALLFIFISTGFCAHAANTSLVDFSMQKHFFGEEIGPFQAAEFAKKWVLIDNEGDLCANEISIEWTQEHQGSIVVSPTEKQDLPPQFSIPAINKGTFKDFIFGDGWLKSDAMGEQGRLYQSATVRVFILAHDVIERQLSILDDGSLEISASERKGSAQTNYRCVYTAVEPRSGR